MVLARFLQAMLSGVTSCLGSRGKPWWYMLVRAKPRFGSNGRACSGESCSGQPCLVTSRQDRRAEVGPAMPCCVMSGHGKSWQQWFGQLSFA